MATISDVAGRASADQQVAEFGPVSTQGITEETPMGANLVPGGGATFRVWAPEALEVHVRLARTGDVNSATAQFFINLKDNDFLNHRDNTQQGFGYCAFGRLVDGLDVLDRIGKVKTHKHPTGYDDVPVEPVVIQSVRRAK